MIAIRTNKYRGEYWKQYKDTRYYASNYGRLKIKWKDGHTSIRTGCVKEIRPGSKQRVVYINGKQVSLARVVYTAFYGDIPEGYNVAHKNKCYFDNHINNLTLKTKKDICCMSRFIRKQVYNVDTDEYYPSTRAAAKKLHIDHATVLNYCNKKTKNPMYNLKWKIEKQKF